MLGDGLRDPAFELERVLGRRRELDLLAARAAGEDRERIARHLVGVDEQHAGRTAPPRLLILVRPAAVVRQRVGLEEVRLLGGRGWVVDEADEHLARHVHVFVVVPLVAGVRDAVADEHERGVERGLRRVEVGRGDVVVHEVERHGLALFGCERERADVGRRRAEEGDGLEEAAARGCAFEAGFLHLLADVLDGFLLARRAGAAPLELVGGEHGDVLPQLRAVDLGEGNVGHGRHISGYRDGVVVVRGGRRGGVVAGGEDEEGEEKREESGHSRGRQTSRKAEADAQDRIKIGRAAPE